MAPTNAKAIYAASTLSLLTKGPIEVIGKAPCSRICPLNADASKSFRMEKVSVAVTHDISTAGGMVKES